MVAIGLLQGIAKPALWADTWVCPYNAVGCPYDIQRRHHTTAIGSILDGQNEIYLIFSVHFSSIPYLSIGVCSVFCINLGIHFVEIVLVL